MSVAYRTVGWNPDKRRYDLVAAGAITLYLSIFVALQATFRPELTIEKFDQAKK